MRLNRKDKSMSLTDTIKQYIDLKLEYIQLTLTEKVSLLIGNLVLLIFIALLSLSLVFLVLLLGYTLLMDWIGIGWLVTIIEIAIVCLLLVLIWVFRSKLVIRPVASMIVKTMLNASDKEEGEDEDE